MAAGIPALIAFGWLLTLAPAEYAGRAYAAYGVFYIVASLLWLWLAEGHVPDQWDLAGGALALIAAGIILFAPISKILMSAFGIRVPPGSTTEMGSDTDECLLVQ